MERALIVNNEWTDEQEELLKKWHKFAIESAWKHSEVAKTYFTRHRMIGIPSTVANAIVGTAIFAGIDDSSKCTQNITLQIILGTIVISVTVIMAVQNFLNLSQTAEKHGSASGRYENYASGIEAELVLPRDQRLNGKIFLKQAQKRLNELKEMCPNIPQSIEQKFNTIKKSDELAELREIIIYKEKKEKKEIKETDLPDDTDDENKPNNNITRHVSNDDIQEQLQKEIEEIRNQDAIERAKNRKASSKDMVDRFLQNF